MSDWLLDSNHLSPFVTLGHALRLRVYEALGHGERFGVAAPMVMEIMAGIISVPRAAENLAEWEFLKRDFLYYGTSLLDAEFAAELQVSLRRRGWQLHSMDALIAAVAIRNDLVLLTTDRDFRTVPGLKYTNWLE